MPPVQRSKHILPLAVTAASTLLCLSIASPIGARPLGRRDSQESTAEVHGRGKLSRTVARPGLRRGPKAAPGLRKKQHVDPARDYRKIRSAFSSDKPNEWSKFLRSVTTQKEVRRVTQLARSVTRSEADARRFVVAFYRSARDALEAQSDETREFLENVPGDWHKKFPIYYTYPDGLSAGDRSRSPLEQLAAAQGRDGDKAYALYLLPFWRSGGIDGGFDIVDYLVDEKYGGENGLRSLLSRTRSLGVPVIADIIPNHVSIDHPWVQRLKRGDPAVRDRFLIADPTFRKIGEKLDPETQRTYAVYRERDGRETERWIIFPQDSRDHVVNIKTHSGEELGLYHTFYRSQPDVDLRNSEVFNYFLDVQSSLINRGVLGIRVDAAQHLLKRPGTRSEGLSETRDLIALFNRHAKLVGRGKVKIFPEVGADTRASAKYLGRTVDLKSGGRTPEISDGIFGFETRTRLIESVVHRDRAPFLDMIASFPRMPANSTVLAMDMHHDELPFEFLHDPAHARKLLERGEAFRDGGGVSGRTLSLLGGNKRQLQLVWALKSLAIHNSTPITYYGEEAGTGNSSDYATQKQREREDSLRAQGLPVTDEKGARLSYDARDIHRARQLDFDDVRNRAERFKPGQVYRRMLDLRARRPTLRGRGKPTRLRVKDEGTIALVRPGEDGDRPILFVANLDRHAKTVRLPRQELERALGGLDARTILSTTGRLRFRERGKYVEIELEPESFAVADSR